MITDAWIRHHRTPRTDLFGPFSGETTVLPMDLSGERETCIEFLGTPDLREPSKARIEDNFQSCQGSSLPLAWHWVGRTRFKKRKRDKYDPRWADRNNPFAHWPLAGD